MKQEEFDRFAQEYRSLHAQNIAISGENPDYFAEYKIKDLQQLLWSRNSAKNIRILDFGCGVGNSLGFLRQYFPYADIHGADVSLKSLEIVTERYGNQFTLHHLQNSDSLSQWYSQFDVIFVACVFHHIDHTEHISILKQLNMLLRKNGILMIFEHNPLNPLTVHAVNTCPFDENAHLLTSKKLVKSLKESGFIHLGVNYRLFFPHFARALRKWEPYLTWCPFGAQYFVYGIK